MRGRNICDGGLWALKVRLVDSCCQDFLGSEFDESGFNLSSDEILSCNGRAMVRALGLAAVVAIPVVKSIVEPTPAKAATCVPLGPVNPTVRVALVDDGMKNFRTKHSIVHSFGFKPSLTLTLKADHSERRAVQHSKVET
jgi:hypothetical protein